MFRASSVTTIALTVLAVSQMPTRTEGFLSVSPTPVHSTTGPLFMNKKKKKTKKKSSGGGAKGFASALRDLRESTFQYAGSIQPGVQSPQKVVTDPNIMKPDYAVDGFVSHTQNYSNNVLKLTFYYYYYYL